MVKIHNVETNEISEREMTDIEFSEYQSQQAERALVEVEAQAKATAKAALLDKLGITEDEAKLLLS